MLKKMADNFLKTDEREEAISSLEVLADALEKVTFDPYHWKWVILSLHSALQGSMVLALRSGDGLRPLRDNIAQEWLKAYRTGTEEYPKEELDTFLNLYKKIKSDLMLFFGHSKKFVPEGNQGWSIKKINKLRNDFIHFLPKSYLLDISGLPNICKDCLRIIEFLFFKSGNITITSDTLEKRAKRSLKKAKTTLKTLSISGSSHKCMHHFRPW